VSLKYHMHIFKRLESIYLSIFMCPSVRSHLGHGNQERSRKVQILKFESGRSLFTINMFSVLEEKTKQWSDKTYTSTSSDHIKRFLVKKLVHVNRNLLINELVL
jgi:hypothetical protein